MPQTSTQINARLVKVRAAIDIILDGGVAEFAHDGGDKATMLGLPALMEMEQDLEKQLARLTRGTKSRFIRATRY